MRNLATKQTILVSRHDFRLKFWNVALNFKLLSQDPHMEVADVLPMLNVFAKTLVRDRLFNVCMGRLIELFVNW